VADLLGDRYKLVERLGDGAMAEVWAADDEELDRRVAIKLLRSGADPARFEREARAVAALADPNVVGVYDYGVAEGRPFIVLEHLPGGTLADLLHDGRPVADDDAARITAEIASGLAHAHARGLVHRDLKPANILFDGEGRAKIADFGIARMGAAATLTEAGTVLGTPAYLSPEQLSRGARDARKRRLLARRDRLPAARRASALRGR
jgi:serine/threonine-protein kinase